jgi:hypothetical protein
MMTEIKSEVRWPPTKAQIILRLLKVREKMLTRQTLLRGSQKSSTKPSVGSQESDDSFQPDRDDIPPGKPAKHPD